ncbi:uncharacterized protein [Parasteatoda tepidariorum]
MKSAFNSTIPKDECDATEYVETCYGDKNEDELILPDIAPDSEYDDTSNDVGQSASSSIPEMPQQQCVHKKRRGESKRRLNSRKRNSGENYRLYGGKGPVVKSAEIGRDCKCPKKCFEKIEVNERQILFHTFWKLQDFNAQNKFIFDLIKIENVKRRYTKGDSRRSVSVVYNMQLSGHQIAVCKKAFASILGLQNHVGRINNIVKKMKTTSALPPDGRGHHASHPLKYSDSDINQVHKHIHFFLKYKSHYSMNKNLNKQYILMEHSLCSLYEDYVANYCEENNIRPVSEDKYRRIFSEDFNINFEQHKSKAYLSCDQLHVKSTGLKDNEEKSDKCTS